MGLIPGWELRSHMLRGVAQKRKRKISNGFILLDFFILEVRGMSAKVVNNDDQVSGFRN